MFGDSGHSKQKLCEKSSEVPCERLVLISSAVTPDHMILSPFWMSLLVLESSAKHLKDSDPGLA